MSRLERFARFTGAARLTVLLVALWKLWHDPRTPRTAKWLAIAVLAYAVSPIDLIPDFVPLIGTLDDLILVPLGVALVVRLTPAPLWHELLAQAQSSTEKLPRLWWGALIVLLVWMLLSAALGWWLWHMFSAR
jgi:uncharacterized membrane protein YkvA (DUF1232 family)